MLPILNIDGFTVGMTLILHRHFHTTQPSFAGTSFANPIHCPRDADVRSGYTTPTLRLRQDSKKVITKMFLLESRANTLIITFKPLFYPLANCAAAYFIRELVENMIVLLGLESCAQTIVGDVFRKGLR